MKTKSVLFAALLLVPALALAAPGDGKSKEEPKAEAAHRYVIERTFPAGALDGLNDEAKARINATNAKFGVKWLVSYANADKTKTYCVYEGPSEAAVREAAQANEIPVDSVTEVPVTLTP
ncbi:hypothetical protein GCM10027084_22580 [Pseudoxanthomonas sangjuensis]|uniref:DUF4242 domain-containing protein n=1 Tax=Pseudoxanthomonas sangjuensis TaxID=1503750 RepID=UPI001391DCC0|nr:DUF4242 domain-containing protein [Pseudoxanthomonas sangjuensis]KAF1715030.1 hypothetical protein CSC71_02115 [Pseudoxanthomonas sangjuensis]